MSWEELKTTLTTPPPPRLRPSTAKAPLFTSSFFSTTSFGPGHLVGAGILALGIWGVVKYARRARQEAEATRLRMAQVPAVPPGPPSPSGSPGPVDDPKLAQVENARGQYGRRP